MAIHSSVHLHVRFLHPVSPKISSSRGLINNTSKNKVCLSQQGRNHITSPTIIISPHRTANGKLFAILLIAFRHLKHRLGGKGCGGGQREVGNGRWAVGGGFPSQNFPKRTWWEEFDRQESVLVVMAGSRTFCCGRRIILCPGNTQFIRWSTPHSLAHVLSRLRVQGTWWEGQWSQSRRDRGSREGDLRGL